MRLIYEKTGNEVKVGDVVSMRDGSKATVKYFKEPTKSTSTGKVLIEEDNGFVSERYTTVFGMEWVDRD